MINILADIDFILDAFNPASIVRGIAERMRERRLEDEPYATKPGKKIRCQSGLVSRRFLREIMKFSLSHLLMLAVACDALRNSLYSSHAGNLKISTRPENLI